jgi:RNA polymerase-binding transcription factor DksA
MSDDYAGRERAFALVERERAEVERGIASAGGHDKEVHAWAAVLHDRVAALHDRAAALHSRTAKLRSDERRNRGMRRLPRNRARCASCGAPIADASEADDQTFVVDGATAHLPATTNSNELATVSKGFERST